MSENKHFRDITPEFVDSVVDHQVKVRVLKTFKANEIKKKARTARAAKKKSEELAIANPQVHEEEKDEVPATQSVSELEWSKQNAIDVPGMNIKKPKEHLHEESLARMAVLHKERIAMNKGLAESLATSNAERVLRLQLSNRIAQHEANLAQWNAELELERMEEEEDTAE